MSIYSIDRAKSNQGGISTSNHSHHSLKLEHNKKKILTFFSFLPPPATADCEATVDGVVVDVPLVGVSKAWVDRLTWKKGENNISITCLQHVGSRNGSSRSFSGWTNWLCFDWRFNWEPVGIWSNFGRFFVGRVRTLHGHQSKSQEFIIEIIVRVYVTVRASHRWISIRSNLSCDDRKRERFLFSAYTYVVNTWQFSHPLTRLLNQSKHIIGWVSQKYQETGLVMGHSSFTVPSPPGRSTGSVSASAISFSVSLTLDRSSCPSGGCWRVLSLKATNEIPSVFLVYIII